MAKKKILDSISRWFSNPQRVSNRMVSFAPGFVSDEKVTVESGFGYRKVKSEIPRIEVGAVNAGAKGGPMVSLKLATSPRQTFLSLEPSDALAVLEFFHDQGKVYADAIDAVAAMRLAWSKDPDAYRTKAGLNEHFLIDDQEPEKTTRRY